MTLTGLLICLVAVLEHSGNYAVAQVVDCNSNTVLVTEESPNDHHGQLSVSLAAEVALDCKIRITAFDNNARSFIQIFSENQLPDITIVVHDGADENAGIANTISPPITMGLTSTTDSLTMRDALIRIHGTHIVPDNGIKINYYMGMTESTMCSDTPMTLTASLTPQFQVTPLFPKDIKGADGNCVWIVQGTPGSTVKLEVFLRRAARCQKENPNPRSVILHITDSSTDYCTTDLEPLFPEEAESFTIDMQYGMHFGGKLMFRYTLIEGTTTTEAPTTPPCKGKKKKGNGKKKGHNKKKNGGKKKAKRKAKGKAKKKTKKKIQN